VKKFLKEEGHADSYHGLKINWITGLPPTLVCFRGQEQVESMDLSPMSTSELHKLMHEKGYKRSMPPSLFAKRERGEDVTEKDWTEYLEDYARRKKAREERDANANDHKLNELDKDPKDIKIGASTNWCLGKRTGDIVADWAVGGNAAAGVLYRTGPSIRDPAPDDQIAKWGMESEGVLVKQGWVKFDTKYGERYLQMEANGVTILRPCPKSDQASDHKDDAPSEKKKKKERRKRKNGGEL
jgi:hypothetical protein